MLHRYEDKLRIPYVANERDIINQLLDLEVNHIARQFNEKTFKVDKDDQLFVRLLREIRNDIAHQAIVELNTLRRIEEVESKQESTLPYG